jgi:hypothetical protein
MINPGGREICRAGGLNRDEGKYLNYFLKRVLLTIRYVELLATGVVDYLSLVGYLVGGLVVDEDSRGTGALDEAVEHWCMLGVSE